MPPRRPAAVLLDAGDTLFRERTSRARIYCDVARVHRVDVPEPIMASAMDATHRSLPREVDGHFRYSQAWFVRYIEEVFARVGYAGPLGGLTRDLFAAFDAPGTFALFAETRPVVKRLKGAGIRLAVVSNWSPRLHGLLGRLGLLHDFGAVVISAVSRVEKPDPGIFRIALRELGVDPEDAVHVGDHPQNDVDGANAVGVRGVLLDREGRHPDHPDRIATLTEVLPRVGLDPTGIE